MTARQDLVDMILRPLNVFVFLILLNFWHLTVLCKVLAQDLMGWKPGYFSKFRPGHPCYPLTAFHGIKQKCIGHFWFETKKCLIPIKAVKGSWVARIGRNFDDYPGFQLMRSWAKLHYFIYIFWYFPGSRKFLFDWITFVLLTTSIW